MTYYDIKSHKKPGSHPFFRRYNFRKPQGGGRVKLTPLSHSRFRVKNELNKAYFDHDATYIDSKDLAKRTVSNKILEVRAYRIAINLKYDEYQRGLASMIFNLFGTRTGSEAIANLNEELAQELHKPVIKLKRRKVYARFKENIWAADLAEMGILSSKNRGTKYLLCVIGFFAKYVWATL